MVEVIVTLSKNQNKATGIKSLRNTFVAPFTLHSRWIAAVVQVGLQVLMVHSYHREVRSFIFFVYLDFRIIRITEKISG